MTVPDEVIKDFLGSSQEHVVTPLGSGLIHQTLRLQKGAEEFVFQRLNNQVFANMSHVMDNIRQVTFALKGMGEETLEFLPSQKDGTLLSRDRDGGVWRCSRHIANTVTYDSPPSPAHLKNAAKAFAKFASLLSTRQDLKLHAIIDGFHDTPRRFVGMEKAWEGAPQERQSVRDFYALKMAGSAFQEFGLDGLLAPHVPQAVSHNDTKLNNCLFRADSLEVACVIDLDTVMNGSWLLDFGDLCRTAICPLPEDTEDLDAIGVDLERFQALVEGYAEVLAASISKEEKKRMVYSVYLLTYELALRFFTDYLQEDRYFGVNRPYHNLHRTRAQLTLALKIAAAREDMEQIVRQTFR